ncbi:histidine kinase [Bacteroidales bacterium OttesenSCG-928-A17]|nr:histidine kinase [Bacteroidales bacterium OttesenSCG-928-A17]
MKTIRDHYTSAIERKKTPLQLALVIGLVLLLIMLISFFFARIKVSGNLHIKDVVTYSSVCVFLSNVFLLYFLFAFQFWILRRIKNPKKRALYILFGSLILVFILSPIFSRVQWFVVRETLPPNLYTIVLFTKDLILLLITLLIISLINLLEETRKILIENQKLSMESLQNRYDALKNQVDPHFLFNSLNTLKGLVGYDDEKAHEYVDQLSSVFRYTMQGKQVMKLPEELEFVKSYIYLMKIRYNEALQIDYHPDEKYFEYYILPFGLQSLIENAVKHNVITQKYPLMITVETTDRDTILVKNNIHLKSGAMSSGIGLANLNERYKMIFDKEIIINKDDSFFIVEIPLIKDIEKYKDKFNEEL